MTDCILINEETEMKKMMHVKKKIEEMEMKFTLNIFPLLYTFPHASTSMDYIQFYYYWFPIRKSLSSCILTLILRLQNWEHVVPITDSMNFMKSKSCFMMNNGTWMPLFVLEIYMEYKEEVLGQSKPI